MTNEAIRWIESGGGPLVLIDEAHVPQWMGTDTDDYDDACEIDDYAGKLLRSWGEVVVLGDESMRTAVIRSTPDVRVIRWMYAPNDQSALELARRPLPNPSQAAERLAVSLSEGKYMLFDGAEPGTDAVERLELDLSSCTELRTYVLKEGEVGLVVHTFE